MTIHTGEIVEIDHRGLRARVRVSDHDNFTTGWLSIPQSGRNDASLPPLGSRVALTLDERGEWGVIHGRHYSDAEPSPLAGDGQTVRRFGDGSEIRYDEGSHTLTADIAGVRLEIGPDGVKLTTPKLEIVGAIPTVNGRRIRLE